MLDEDTRHHHEKLWVAVFDYLRHKRIAGASVTQGFGENAEMHRHHVLEHDQPLEIVIVDDATRIARLVPELESMMHSGVIAISDVKVRRVTKGRSNQT